MNSFLNIGLQVLFLEIIVFIFRINLSARWFFIHFWVNMLIVWYSLEDVYQVFQNPFKASQGQYSMLPIWIITLLHIYHIIAFPMRGEDWFHHLVMIGIICGIGIYMPGWGAYSKFMVFYILWFTRRIRLLYIIFA